MEQTPPKLMTPFDCTTTPDWLYMMKLMLPYTPEKLQHSLAVFIRFQEMQHTLRYFHSISKKNISTSILSDIKPYMEPSAQEMLEQMESMMSMMEMMQTMNDNTSDNSEGFNPMDMFSDLFNMKGDYNNE